MNYRKNSIGFTLVELMIVVAIVGILAAMAYPSFSDSIRKGRRNDGMATLLDAAQKLEVFRSRQASYTTTPGAANISATSVEGYYGGLTIQAGDCGNIVNCYVLEISPTSLKGQDDDTVQGYRLTSTGTKTRLEDGSWEDGWK